MGTGKKHTCHDWLAGSRRSGGKETANGTGESLGNPRGSWKWSSEAGHRPWKSVTTEPWNWRVTLDPCVMTPRDKVSSEIFLPRNWLYLYLFYGYVLPSYQSNDQLFLHRWRSKIYPFRWEVNEDDTFLKYCATFNTTLVSVNWQSKDSSLYRSTARLFDFRSTRTAGNAVESRNFVVASREKRGKKQEPIEHESEPRLWHVYIEITFSGWNFLKSKRISARTEPWARSLGFVWKVESILRDLADDHRVLTIDPLPQHRFHPIWTLHGINYYC